MPSHSMWIPLYQPASAGENKLNIEVPEIDGELYLEVAEAFNNTSEDLIAIYIKSGEGDPQPAEGPIGIGLTGRQSVRVKDSIIWTGKLRVESPQIITGHFYRSTAGDGLRLKVIFEVVKQ